VFQETGDVNALVVLQHNLSVRELMIGFLKVVVEQNGRRRAVDTKGSVYTKMHAYIV